MDINTCRRKAHRGNPVCRIYFHCQFQQGNIIINVVEMHVWNDFDNSNDLIICFLQCAQIMISKIDRQVWAQCKFHVPVYFKTNKHLVKYGIIASLLLVDPLCKSFLCKIPHKMCAIYNYITKSVYLLKVN